MDLYTSYFYQIRKFPSDLVGLSTAVWPPKYIHLGQKDQNGVIVLNCPPLIPGEGCSGMCEGKCSVPHACDFLNSYRKQLDDIDFNQFMNKLENLRKKITDEEDLCDVDFAFLVFEAPNNPCSERVVIQEWFKKHNVNIREFVR